MIYVFCLKLMASWKLKATAMFGRVSLIKAHLYGLIRAAVSVCGSCYINF